MISRGAVDLWLRNVVCGLGVAGFCLMTPAPGLARTTAAPGKVSGNSRSTTNLKTVSKTSGTTGTAAGSGLTTATTPALHIGQLSPVDEARNIREAMDSMTTVPETDVLLGYDFAAPAGWYQLEGNVLVWHEPSPSDTHRLTMTVQDAADLRVLPDAKVNVRLVDPTANKDLTTTLPLSFLWAPEFFQYAANLTLPEKTEKVDLHVSVEPPTFRRRDQTLGAFFAQPIHYVFKGVAVPGAARPEPVPGVPTTRGLFSEGRRAYAEPTPYPGASNSTTHEKRP